jgi:hypothetical protein
MVSEVGSSISGGIDSLPSMKQEDDDIQDIKRKKIKEKYVNFNDNQLNLLILYSFFKKQKKGQKTRNKKTIMYIIVYHFYYYFLFIKYKKKLFINK